MRTGRNIDCTSERHSCLRAMILPAVVLLLSSSAWAQTEAPAPEQLKPSCRATAQVVDAYRIDLKPSADGQQSVISKTRGELALGDFVTVEVRGLKTLFEEMKCRDEDLRRIDNRDLIENLVLFLDDRPLPDVTPYPPADLDFSAGAEQRLYLLHFPLNRTAQAESRLVWRHLLGRPRWDARPTRISIGLRGRAAIASTATDKPVIVTLATVPHGWVLFWSAVFAVGLIGFFVLALKTDLLRDSSRPVAAGRRPPFSLARTQAAWWFFLVMASYLFIGIVTGEFADSLSGTALVLLGIGAATAVGSAFIDQHKSSTKSEEDLKGEIDVLTAKALGYDCRLNELALTMETLQNTINDPATLPTDKDTARVDLAARQVENAKAAEELSAVNQTLSEKIKQIGKLQNQAQNFIQDILSDVNGISFHRFQMVAFALVLGVVFILEVWKTLAMPEWSETLLGLLGISAGTFLGLKMPEATVPKTG